MRLGKEGRICWKNSSRFCAEKGERAAAAAPRERTHSDGDGISLQLKTENAGNTKGCPGRRVRDHAFHFEQDERAKSLGVGEEGQESECGGE